MHFFQNFALVLVLLDSASSHVLNTSITHKEVEDFEIEKIVNWICNKYLDVKDFVATVNVDLHLRTRSGEILNPCKKYMEYFPFRAPNAYILNGDHATIDCIASTVKWNPRAKFIVISNNNRPIEPLIEQLKSYFVFNAIILFDKGIFTYFHKNSDAVLLTNYSTIGDESINLFPDKTIKDWTNFNFNVAMLEYPPYTGIKDNGRKTGIEYNVLMLLQSKLGFSLNVDVKNYNGWGALLSNGTFTLFYGDLQKRKYDAAIGLFFQTVKTQSRFDMTFPYVQDFVMWVVPVAKSLVYWRKLLRIFTITTWILLALSWLSSTLMMWLIGVLKKDDFGIGLLMTYGAFFNQAVASRIKALHLRLIFTFWCLLVFIISSDFQNNFVSVLHFREYERQIKTIDEIKESGMNFGFYPESDSLFNFIVAPRDVYFKKYHSTCYLDCDCLDRTAYEKNFATMKMKRYLDFSIRTKYMDSDGNPVLYIVDEPMVMNHIGLVFARGSPMFREVDKMVLELASKGFVVYFVQKAEQYAERKASSRRRLLCEFYPLGMNDIKGLFYLLFIGWTLAIVSWALELILEKIFR